MKDKIDFVRYLLGIHERSEVLTHVNPPTNYFDNRKSHSSDFAQCGLRLLKEGKVAALMVAGGLSSRMKAEGLRGDMPIGPVTDRSIFRLQAEKFAAIRRRFAPNMQWLILTSPAIHSATVHSFESNDFFGLPSDDIHFFQQSTLPVLDMEGRIIHLVDGQYLENPTGHGGVLEALEEASLLQELIDRGIDYIFYFQYPNVLEQICDPVMLGYHHKNGYEVTTKAITDYDPKEKMGRCTERNGLLYILEYHFLQNFASNPSLRALPASIGTHVWSVSFLKRCINNDIRLPYHKIVYHDASVNQGPLQKVEQFVFDLLHFTEKKGLLLVNRNTEYAPVKTRGGLYSLESAQKALSEQYISWMEEAGAVRETPETLTLKIEIGPHFALGPNDLKGRLPSGFTFNDGLVLD